MSDILNKLDEELVKLDDIAQKFFNVSPNIARRKAALNALPVPAFRINGGRKGPLFVRKADLDQLLKERFSEAQRQHREMQLAGAV